MTFPQKEDLNFVENVCCQSYLLFFVFVTLLVFAYQL